MRAFIISNLWMTNVALWLFFHIAISILCLLIPQSFFLKKSDGFKLYAWERSGNIWQSIFRVKKWKNFLIDGAALSRIGYGKKQLHGNKRHDLILFAAETRRAELTHWLSILPAPLFFLWNPFWAGCLMIAYALVFNFPFIIVQRYNRGRILSILSPKDSKTKKDVTKK